MEHAGAHRKPIVDSLDHALARVLLLGEDNPQSSDPRHALYNHPVGCAGERLQRVVMGVGPYEYRAMWRTNLCSPTWDKAAARDRASRLLCVGTPWDVVVCLGVKVATAVREALEDVGAPDGYGWADAYEAHPGDLEGIPADCLPRPVRAPVVLDTWSVITAHKHLRENKQETAPVKIVALPHPSGRCRAWNDPDAVKDARDALFAAAPQVPWGVLDVADMLP